MLSRNLVGRSNEDTVLPAARFLAEHGDVVGARAPSTVERNKAMGLEAYMANLQTDESEAYDAQGNHFEYKNCDPANR